MGVQPKKLQKTGMPFDHAENETIEKEKESLNSTIKSLEDGTQYMQDLLADNSEVELLHEETQSFTPKVMKCVMNLTNSNIAHHRVGQVIKDVLPLADKVPNRVLSRQTVDNIVSAKSIVAQKQLAANLPEKQHTTLYTNGAQKFGKSYNVYVTTDKDKIRTCLVCVRCTTRGQRLQWIHCRRL